LPPPLCTPFPYTTLFRSAGAGEGLDGAGGDLDVLPEGADGGEDPAGAGLPAEGEFQGAPPGCGRRGRERDERTGQPRAVVADDLVDRAALGDAAPVQEGD